MCVQAKNALAVGIAALTASAGGPLAASLRAHAHEWNVSERRPRRAPPVAVRTDAYEVGVPVDVQRVQPQIVDGQLWLPHSILPAAATGPAGTSAATVALQKPGGEGRSSRNVHRFFLIVLIASGLQAVYLAIGLLLGTWMLTRPANDPAIAMTALYWVVVGAAGLLLLPAFYL